MSDLILDLDLERAIHGDGTIGLRNVQLQLRAGEIVGVAGHVGAGKSTLALAASGLLTRSMSGRIVGRLRHPRGGQPPAACVFSNPWTQLTELGGSVQEEVAVGPENQALPSEVIRRRVDTALELASARHLANRQPHELSGGELQRVALASALALEAPLLVLDEPTAQLDPEGTASLAETLRHLTESGMAILLMEQRLDLLRDVAHRVLVLSNGSPLALGSADILEEWPPLDARLGVTARTELRHAAPRTRRMGGDPILLVRDLSGGYGEVDVINGMNVEVPSGHAIAVTGPNGAGKSTFIRMLMGLVRARRGTIHVARLDMTRLPTEERARHIGMVFQEPSRQLFSRSVLDAASFGPRTLGASRAQARDQALEALSVVSLDQRRATHPGDLTSQEQRLLAIAAAMAARPALLLLDEPTAGQDAAGRAAISRAIAVQRERGSALVVTHDLAFAAGTCDGRLAFALGGAYSLS